MVDAEEVDVALEQQELRAHDEVITRRWPPSTSVAVWSWRSQNEVADRLMIHNALAAHACDQLGITEALRALAARTGDANLGKQAICVMFWVSLAMIVTAGVGAILETIE